MFVVMLNTIRKFVCRRNVPIELCFSKYGDTCRYLQVHITYIGICDKIQITLMSKNVHFFVTQLSNAGGDFEVVIF